jgi:hypothetical protein
MSTITVPTTLTAISSSAFGVPVANQLNQQADYIEFIPGSTLSTPGAGTADWFTVGTITVPAWATKARIDVLIDNIFSGAAQGSATCVVKLGTIASTTRNVQGIAAAGGHAWCTAVLLTGISTGSQTLKVTATFVSGAVISVGTTSAVACPIMYLG